MKFAICNELFEGWDFGDACRYAASVGYTGIEIAPYTLPVPVRQFSQSDRSQMRQEAVDAGIEIIGLHWVLAKTEGFHISHPDAAVRDATVDYLGELARLCGDLGGRIMVFGSPKQRSVMEGMTYQQAWELAKDTFSRLRNPLRQAGVTLCLEPLGPQETNFMNTADEALRMVGEIGDPNIQLLLDVKAMSTESRDMGDIIRSSAGYVKHFHANDANMRGPGFGDTDFRPVVEALREIGYDGWVSVEVFDFTPDPETIASKSMEYLKQVFGA